ncbi:hypothetical protein VTJ83DRAFT_2253 [Remersonia thermophila]|uniref:Yeast cell wall synthesis Kre9/Knh1-like N-terminal domain-containing protein n=1 Tax=Remersonia thermophila TaxID=72144 RepID=A0ABR4DID0_9PEZI
MKVSFGAVLAFAAAVLAKPILTNSEYTIVEGQPFTLTWQNAEGPVTLSIMTGSSNNLKHVVDIATVPEGETSYTFTLNDLPSGTYAIRITDATGEPNYSVMWSYLGTALPSTTETSATSSSTATSSVSSTSSASSTETETSVTSSASTTASTTASASATTLVITTTQTPTTTRNTQPTEAPENTNSGNRFMSPLALVLGTVAALVFFN